MMTTTRRAKETRRHHVATTFWIIALISRSAIGFQPQQVRRILSIRGHQQHHGDVPVRRGAGWSPANVKCRQSIGDAFVNSALPIVLTTFNTLRKEVVATSTIQKGFVLTAWGLGFGAGRATPFWKRYTDAAEIPLTMLERQRTLCGSAVFISDGDTLRFLHRPTVWSPRQLKQGQKASEWALQVRLCTVDTPETAKFGEQGQPFAKEAKDLVTKLLSNRPVFIQLLKRDQYGRIVARVYIRPWRLFPFKKTYIDEELLRQGLAEVYTGAGAVYGVKGKESYLQMEQAAKSKKIGMWSQGSSKRESAAEYKKRTK